jgi:hypothetical protein
MRGTASVHGDSPVVREEEVAGDAAAPISLKGDLWEPERPQCEQRLSQAGDPPPTGQLAAMTAGTDHV